MGRNSAPVGAARFERGAGRNCAEPARDWIERLEGEERRRAVGFHWLKVHYDPGEQATPALTFYMPLTTCYNGS